MPEPAAPVVVSPDAVLPPGISTPTPGDNLGASTNQDVADSNSALEALLKAAEVEVPAEVVPDEPAKPAEPAAPAAPAVPAEPAAPAAPAAPVDEFDKVELPPHSSPKSGEAFAKVKQLAQERIAAVEKERAALAERLTAAEEAAKKTTAPAEETPELKELREFRLKFDAEADPSFRKWDEAVKSNDELIYSKLRGAGVNEESLKKIAELGGPNQVDWESVSEKFSPQLRRYIETKVFENEDLVEKKKAAIEAAKKNVSEFIRTRQEQIFQNTEGRQKAMEKEFNELKPNLEWMQEIKVPATATEADKAKAERNNKIVARVNADLQEAINDDSPRMRAILIAGFAQLMKTRTDLEDLKADKDAELAKLNATLKERDDFIARIKKSTTGRLHSAAPSPGDARPAPKVDYHEDGASAVERLYREAQAKTA